ncbi:MAG TPA: hypothetical protein VEX38_10955, partial [Fimbriimonadaceae bacterium]|nr:hypothetical protein [Fimbriimonadaceae bacterium]
FCVLVARTHEAPVIAIGATAPLALERLIAREGGRLLRSGTDVPSLMAASLLSGATFAGDERGGFAFPEFHPGFDAAFGLARLIRMLEHSGCTLSELRREVPPFYTSSTQVHCPWEAKGMVMREIAAEASEPYQVESGEGIRIAIDDASWVLVLPDALEPHFHVFSESENIERAEALARDYGAKIEQLCGSGR